MPFDLPWWGFLEMLAIMLLIFGGLVWVIFQWVKYYNRKNNNALETARQRYAKGEIDKAAYEDIKKTL